MRGFMHSIVIEFAALNIIRLDLSTPLAGNLLQLMGTFGISNYLTGIMLVLIDWKARPLALAMQVSWLKNTIRSLNTWSV